MSALDVAMLRATDRYVARAWTAAPWHRIRQAVPADRIGRPLQVPTPDAPAYRLTACGLQLAGDVILAPWLPPAADRPRCGDCFGGGS